MRSLMFLCVLFTLIGCSDNDCDASRQPVLCLEDLGCLNAPFNVSIESVQEFELIRNQEDFDRMVFSNCEFEIDWINFDLVIGTKGLSNGLSYINKTILNDCNANQKHLTVDIFLNETTIAPLVTWQALIPKIEDTESLFVTININ